MKAKTQIESHLLVLVTLGLVAFGLVMVYSATSAPAALERTDPMSYLKKQGVYALIGVGLMMAASRFDYRRLRLLAPALVLTALGGCLAVLVIGTRINGARRWIEFGPATFQPSELAKLALAVWAAAYLCKRPAPRSLRELWRPIGLLLGVFCVLILAEPDLGTAISLVVVLLAVLLISGTPTATLASGTGIAVALGLIAIWFEPYRRARLFSFIDPWKDPQGAGFQTVQALISIGSGGFLGAGLGHGVAKINYLPEAHTDMIFAVIGEELGSTRRDRRDRRVCRVRIRGLASGAGVHRSIRQAPGRGDRRARRRAGRDQPRRSARAGASDRNSAAVHLLRRLQSRGRAPRGGHPP